MVVKNPITEEQDKRWDPPPFSRFKCNTDGSWKQESGVGGGLDGQMLWVGAKMLPDVGSVLETEAEALRWAMSSLTRFGYGDVLFETDFQVLVKMLQGVKEI